MADTPTPTTTTTPTKMARQPLTIAEKNELRRFYASRHGSVKHSEMLDWVQTKFGKSMGRSSIGRILNSEVDVDEATMGPRRMRKRSSNYPGVEAALLTFILENRDKVLLTDDVLWDQARLAAEGHAVSMSWIQRFKNRNGIKAKSRSLLSGGSVDGDDTQLAFIAALAKKRDELLEVVANTTTNNNMSAKEEQSKRDGEETEENAATGTDVSKSQEQQSQASSTATVTTTPEKAVASLAKKKAQTPAKSSPKAASPRFTVVSQATGRVELENRADPKRLRKPKPVTKLPITVQSETTAPATATPEPAPAPTSTPAAPVAATITVATNPVSPVRTPERKRSREESEEQVAAAREQPKQQETPSRQQETPSKQQQQQDTPSKAVDDREVELRVEGLRCDNILKRIKIAEENMLARKRLKDAGISQEEIDALLPIVRIV